MLITFSFLCSQNKQRLFDLYYIKSLVFITEVQSAYSAVRTECLYNTDRFCFLFCVPCSSVSIATELRAGRSGIESRWGRDFPPLQTGPGAHPASCKMSAGSFPGVKWGRDVLLTTHPLLVPRS